MLYKHLGMYFSKYSMILLLLVNIIESAWAIPRVQIGNRMILTSHIGYLVANNPDLFQRYAEDAMNQNSTAALQIFDPNYVETDLSSISASNLNKKFDSSQKDAFASLLRDELNAIASIFPKQLRPLIAGALTVQLTNVVFTAFASKVSGAALTNVILGGIKSVLIAVGAGGALSTVVTGPLGIVVGGVTIFGGVALQVAIFGAIKRALIRKFEIDSLRSLAKKIEAFAPNEGEFELKAHLIKIFAAGPRRLKKAVLNGFQNEVSEGTNEEFGQMLQTPGLLLPKEFDLENLKEVLKDPANRTRLIQIAINNDLETNSLMFDGEVHLIDTYRNVDAPGTVLWIAPDGTDSLGDPIAITKKSSGLF